jgi:hypothetical protein
MSEHERSQTVMRDTDRRIDYAEAHARQAGLDAGQVASMQAYLLGALLTHFDEAPVVPLTDARWRRIVAAAIENAT